MDQNITEEDLQGIKIKVECTDEDDVSGKVNDSDAEKTVKDHIKNEFHARTENELPPNIEEIIKNWQQTCLGGSYSMEHAVENSVEHENLKGGSNDFNSVPIAYGENIFPLALVQNVHTYSPSMPFQDVWHSDKSQNLEQAELKTAEKKSVEQNKKSEAERKRKSCTVTRARRETKISKLPPKKTSERLQEQMQLKKQANEKSKEQSKLRKQRPGKSKVKKKSKALMQLQHVKADKVVKNSTRTDKQEEVAKKECLKGHPENIEDDDDPTNDPTLTDEPCNDLSDKHSMPKSEDIVKVDVPKMSNLLDITKCKITTFTDSVKSKGSDSNIKKCALSFKCSECDLAFTSKWSLNKHRRVHFQNFQKQEGLSDTNKDKVLGNRKIGVQTKETDKKPEIEGDVAKRKEEIGTNDKVKFIQKKEPLRKDCHICGHVFTQRSNLVKHLRVHSGEKPYICDFCGKRMSSTSQLNVHRRIHTKEKPYLCPQCGVRFGQRSALVTHTVYKHKAVPKKSHKCDICDKIFPTPSSLESHIRTHTHAKPWICEKCGEGFSEARKLRYHQNKHEGKQPFKCDICAVTFCSPNAVRKHKKRQHDIDKEKTSSRSGNKKGTNKLKPVPNTPSMPKESCIIVKGAMLYCGICDLGLQGNRELTKHRYNAHGLGPINSMNNQDLPEEVVPSLLAEGKSKHVCRICDMKFPTVSHLTIHFRMHSGEKPFICGICSLGFAHRSHCMDHQRIVHEGERKHICKICEKAFSRMSGLKKHLESVHDVKPENFKSETITKKSKKESPETATVSDANITGSDIRTIPKGKNMAPELPANVSSYKDGNVDHLNPGPEKQPAGMMPSSSNAQEFRLQKQSLYHPPVPDLQFVPPRLEGHITSQSFNPYMMPPQHGEFWRHYQN